MREHFQRYVQRREEGLRELESLAKTLSPILKDKGMIETAKTLDEILFKLAVAEQEFHAALGAAGPAEVVEFLKLALRGPK